MMPPARNFPHTIGKATGNRTPSGSDDPMRKRGLTSFAKPLLAVLAAVGLAAISPHAQEPSSIEKQSVGFYIPVEGGIDYGLAYFIERSVRQAKAQGAGVLVFAIDTPGGGVAEALAMCKSIDETAPVRTVAYVTHWAVSAGALIALACDRIVMKQEATIGSAEPIAMAPGMDEALHMEKHVSAIRAEFRARAEKKGYPANLAAAMVDKDLEVLRVTVEGQEAFLTPLEVEDSKRAGRDVVVLETVSEKGKLLNLTASQAVRWKIASAIAPTREGALRAVGIEVERWVETRPSWSEELVRFLTNAIVVIVLLMIGMACVWAELKAPGIGYPALGAAVCFGLLFFGHYLAGLADITDVLVLLAGIAILGVEIFLLPGFGIAGVAGLILIIAGLLLMFQGPAWPKAPWEFDRFRESLVQVLIGLGGAVPLFLLLVALLPKMPYFHRLVLRREEVATEGYSAPPSVDRSLVGRRGRAFTPLHPWGKVEIGNEVFEGVTETGFLDEGTAVEVVRVEENRLVVCRLENPPPTQSV